MRKVTFFSTVKKEKLLLEGYSQVDLLILSELFDEVSISNSIIGFDYKSDLYFSWWASGSIIPLIYSMLFNKPLVVVAGGTESVVYFDSVSKKPYGYTAFNFFKQWIIRFVLANADAVVYVSKNQFIDRVNVRNHICRILPNAVDVTNYNYSAIQSLSDLDYDVMTIFNFDERVIELKRGYSFLEVVKEVLVTHPSLRVLIIGNYGDGFMAFCNYVNKLGLDQNIKILHSVSNHDIYSFYIKSRIYAHFSDYETFGMSVAEAMSVGRPVLLNRLLSLVELVGEDYDFICDINDKREPVDLLRKLLNLSVQELNAVGYYLRTRIVENFSLEHRREELKNLIKKII